MSATQRNPEPVEDDEDSFKEYTVPPPDSVVVRHRPNLEAVTPKSFCSNCGGLGYIYCLDQSLLDIFVVNCDRVDCGWVELVEHWPEFEVGTTSHLLRGSQTLLCGKTHASDSISGTLETRDD